MTGQRARNTFWYLAVGTASAFYSALSWFSVTGNTIFFAIPLLPCIAGWLILIGLCMRVPARHALIGTGLVGAGLAFGMFSAPLAENVSFRLNYRTYRKTVIDAWSRPLPPATESESLTGVDAYGLIAAYVWPNRENPVVEFDLPAFATVRSIFVARRPLPPRFRETLMHPILRDDVGYWYESVWEPPRPITEDVTAGS